MLLIHLFLLLKYLLLKLLAVLLVYLLFVCSVAQEVVRHSLQMEHEAALRKLRQEMEDQLHRAKREREELQDEMRTLQHDRDQCLLQAETEKQQV